MAETAQLPGLERAAVLLMSLGEEYAAEVLRHMEPRDLQRLGAAMATLRNINRDQVSEVLRHFNHEVGELTSMGVESQDFVRSVLVRALGRDRAKGVLEGIVNSDGSTGVDALKWMDSAAIATGLAKEHPQVVALVLSHLQNEQAGEVLARLPEDVRYEALVRIATLDSVPSGALAELNELIEKQVMTKITASSAAKVGGPKRAAEILSQLDGGLEGELLDRIKSDSPDLGNAIEDLMLVFEQLLDVDDRGIQTLLREVSSETLMIALRGADESVRAKIMRNMSKRAAEMMADDLEVMQPVRLSEVERAQKEILATAKRLAEAGELQLGARGGDGYV